jgi:hypothetical protein
MSAGHFSNHQPIEESIMARTKPNTYMIREPRNEKEEPILFPWTEKVARLSEYRPYHGPLREEDGSPVSVNTLRKYLRGELRKGVPTFDLDPDTFDIGKATKGMLLDFAERNYATTLDPTKDIDQLRAQVAALADDAGDTDDDPTTGRENRLKKGRAAQQAEDAAAVKRAKELADKVGIKIPTL